jgi:hypothetical protein
MEQRLVRIYIKIILYVAVTKSPSVLVRFGRLWIKLKQGLGLSEIRARSAIISDIRNTYKDQSVYHASYGTNSQNLLDLLDL